MKTKNYFSKVLFTFLILFSFANYAEALSVDPFEYFNVYSLGDIGQSNDVYNTDIEGTIGAAGNTYWGGFGALNLESNEYVLHTGGDFYIKGGGFNGKIDVGGDVSLANFRLKHNLSAGGNITIPRTTSGEPTATASVAGTVDQYIWNNINAVGGVQYEPIFDFNELNQYFIDTSSAISNMSDVYGTKTYSQIPGGNTYFDVESGINVFEISATDLYATAHFSAIRGPADAIVYINATDIDAHLGRYINWDFIGGVLPSNVIFNFADAETLSIKGGELNILAPFADTTFITGAINGNLITGNLYGGAQVNTGHFDNPSQPVPEPSTLVLLGIGMAGMFGFRKRFRKQL